MLNTAGGRVICLFKTRRRSRTSPAMCPGKQCSAASGGGSASSTACACRRCPAHTGGFCGIVFDAAGKPTCRCLDCGGKCDSNLWSEDPEVDNCWSCGTCFNAERDECMQCPCCLHIHNSKYVIMNMDEIMGYDSDSDDRKRYRKAKRTACALWLAAKAKRAARKQYRKDTKTARALWSAATAKRARRTARDAQVAALGHVGAYMARRAGHAAVDRTGRD